MVARFVRDEEVVGSNPATPTRMGPTCGDAGRAVDLLFLGDRRLRLGQRRLGTRSHCCRNAKIDDVYRPRAATALAPGRARRRRPRGGFEYRGTRPGEVPARARSRTRV